MTKPLLTIDNLSVSYAGSQGLVSAVRGVSVEVAPGEVVALVGESGSGKSTTGHAVMGLLAHGGSVTGGSIQFGGLELTHASERLLRGIRGCDIGLVPQDPSMSLNPVKRIGEQVAEVLRVHGIAGRRTARLRAVDLLEKVGLRNPSVVAKQFPHQLSGGMRQRVLIAIAFAAEPRLIIADEPTSALDVTVQKRVLDHLESLTRESGTAVLLVTHDLGVALDRADSMVVMKNGKVVERGPAVAVFESPEHPYTQRLIAAAPSLAGEIRQARDASHTAPLVTVRGLTKTFALPGSKRGVKEFCAVDDVSFEVHPGETFALVGESGSGKSTTARLVLGLERPSRGVVQFRDQDVTSMSANELRAFRRQAQMVYQSPYASLDPRFSVEQIITEPLRAFKMTDRAGRRTKAEDLVERVGLPASMLRRTPNELSGGQRQRVAIARALALSPELVVCDEPVSALDVSVQAQVLDLLCELQETLGLTYLFISHDLAVVRQIAHRIGVMSAGELVEVGDTPDIFAAPRHEYTRALLEAIPGARRGVGPG